MEHKLGLSQLIKGTLVIHILWIILSFVMNKSICPYPWVVYAGMPEAFREGMVLHIGASLFRIIMGLGIAMILGIGIGLSMAGSKRMNQMLGTLVYFTYPIPKTVLLPILMLFFGIGNGSKITLIVLIVIFQVIVSTRDAAMNVEKETYDVVVSLGGTRRQRFFHVTFPAIIPDLLTNIRLSVGTALSILFFAEGYGTHYGIGYYILDAWSRMNYQEMYGGIVMISVVGLLLFISIDRCQLWACRWQNHTQVGGKI